MHPLYGEGIEYWWPLSLRPSVCPVPDLNSRTEWRRKLKIDRKETHDTGDPWPRLQAERSKTFVGNGKISAPHSLCVLAWQARQRNRISQIKSNVICQGVHLHCQSSCQYFIILLQFCMCAVYFCMSLHNVILRICCVTRYALAWTMVWALQHEWELCCFTDE